MGELRWEIAEKGSWELDSGHFPTPITPFLEHMLRANFARGFAEGARNIGMLIHHFDHEVVNGFDYIAPRIVGAPRGAKGPPPKIIFKLLTWLHPEIRRRLATAARAFVDRPWREDLRLWQQDVRPASTRTHLELQRRDPGPLADAELATLLEDLERNAHQQYYWHHRLTVSAMLPVGDFIVHARDWTGLPTGDVMQAVRQPTGVATDASDQHDAAVRAIAADPAARALVEGHGSSGAALDQLRALPGAAGDAIRTWLEYTGLRLVTGYDICDLYGLEMPDLLIRTLRAGLGGRDDRAADQLRQEQTARIRDAVPAAHRDAYDAILAEARSVSNLREERALVCDFWAFGMFRRAAKEAGKRLAAAGRIDAPLHLLDASVADMLALVRSGAGPSAQELAARHHYRTTATWEIAPKRLGIPPSAPPPAAWYPPSTRRMNAAVEAAVEGLFLEPTARSEPTTVRGLNASAGVYEGTARLVLRPAEMDRIQQGDVLIARMTTEAYNGIVPLLGAIVTDRGGLLSHSATVAREYGIPAIVGTQDATRLIPDGARIVVDGSRGEARLVGL